MADDFRRKHRYRFGDFTPAIAVAAACIAASFFIWNLIFISEQRAFAQDFFNRASNQATFLQERISDYSDKINAVRALFDSSDDDITRDEFESFSHSVLEGHDDAILNLSWLPRVTREERAAYELAATLDGLPDYHIRDAQPDGTLPVAPERNEYFSKFYSTESKISPVYGLDLLQEAPATVNHIRDANVLSSSPPLSLHIGGGDRQGFWVGLPVYLRDAPHNTVEERRHNIRGIVQAVFQFHVMIDSVVAKVANPMALSIFAPDAARNDLPVYSTAALDANSAAPKSQAKLAEGLHLSESLAFGDTPWTLVVTPGRAVFLLDGHERSTIMLICGLLLSAALAAFVWTLRRHARDLEIAHARVQMQNVQFNAALNNMVQGLLMYDETGLLRVWNRRFCALLGLPWEEWNAHAAGLTIPQMMELARSLMKTRLKDREQVQSELAHLLRQRQTSRIVLEFTDDRTFIASCSPIEDGGFVLTFEDTTELRRNEKKIAHLAHYDALTDLPNRVLFYEKMDELLSNSRRDGKVAILSLDLDHFKGVNDMLGHPIGDLLLQDAARRMQSCVRETDVVARLGGDEFAILQSPISKPSEASALASRLIDAVSAPYELDDHQVVVGTSVGIAIAPGDGTVPDQLVRNADLALYRCKAEGGNAYRFFETEMDAHMQQRRALELDLRKALVNGEFTLAYQPLVNLKSGKITTCEALIRWHQPERGLVPPLQFIPIAEETGLIVPIGEWVLHRACMDAMEWPEEYAIAVNVSPAQFKSGNFCQTVGDALAQSHLPAQRLELEITELILMQDNDTAQTLLHRLKDLGVRIAMDDFGTGYSSLGYLRSFPFDKIKIDQSFISDLSKNRDGLAILRAVVGLGRSLGIVTTAEGVETQNQLEVLLSEGCTEAQGFFFSQPKSATDLKELFGVVRDETRAIA